MKINYYRCDEDIRCKYSNSFTTTAHAHGGVEIIYLKKGVSPTFINGEEYEIHPDDLFVIFPNSVHYHKYTGELEALVTTFPTRTLPEFHSIFTKKEPKIPLIKNADPHAIELLEKLVEYKNQYKPEAQRGLLMAAVSIILESLSYLDKKEAENTNLGAILEFCDNHYTEDISLETVAKELTVSKYYISRTFTNKLQISFRNYINALRLRHALKLMKENDLTITEIAYESGFTTIRTFNRAFKTKFNLSPLQYKKQMID